MFHIWLCGSFVLVGSEVELSVDSAGYPSFYKDESITLTCTASGNTDPSDVYLINGVSATDDRTACRYEIFENKWGSTNFVSTLGFAAIDNAYCEAAAAATPFILSVTGTVSDDLLRAKFVCLANFASRVNSTSFSISGVSGKLIVLVLFEKSYLAPAFFRIR